MVVSGLTGLLLLPNSALFELFGDRRFRWFPGIGHYPRSLLGTDVYLLAILILWPLGLGHEREPTVRWWLERPLWFAVAGVVLYAMVVVFGPFERSKTPPHTSSSNA